MVAFEDQVILGQGGDVEETVMKESKDDGVEVMADQGKGEQFLGGEWYQDVVEDLELV